LITLYKLVVQVFSASFSLLPHSGQSIAVPIRSSALAKTISHQNRICADGLCTAGSYFSIFSQFLSNPFQITQNV